ncbi:MAG: hypothetical protein AB7S26_41475 [Sandaracinaceae bacterium]
MSAASCALLEDGRIACWGQTEQSYGQPYMGCEPRIVMTEQGKLTGVVRLEVGLGLTPAGELWDWTDPEPIAQRHEGLPPLADIGTTRGTVCAVTRKGEPLCWAARDPCFERAMPFFPRPTMLDGLPRVRAVACGDDEEVCLFVGEDGYLWAWTREGVTRGPPIPSTDVSVVVDDGGCFVSDGVPTCWGGSVVRSRRRG